MLAILSLFTTERGDITVEEASRILDASLRTTYRHVRSLSAAGFLPPIRGGRHVLGPACIQLDWLIRTTDPLTRAAAPVVAGLAERMPAPAVILICRLYRNQVMCVVHAPTGEPPFASSYQRGRPMPLVRGAASKAILALLPKRVVRQLHALHSDEMARSGLGATLAKVEDSLSQIRKAGVSVTSGELDPGLTGIAVPLHGPDMLPFGSLAAVVADATFTPISDARIRTLLQAGAAEVTDALQRL